MAALVAVYGLAYGLDAGLRFDVAAAHALGTRGYDVDFFLFSVRIAFPLALLAIALTALRRDLRRAGAAALILGGGIAGTYALKAILGRADPLHGDAARGIGDFFPSTHAGVATASALAAVALAQGRAAAPVSVAAAFYMAAVGIASVVAGGHYPSDAAGAYAACAAWAALGNGWLLPGRRRAPGLHAVAAVAGAAVAAIVLFAAAPGWAGESGSAVAAVVLAALACPLVVAATRPGGAAETQAPDRRTGMIAVAAYAAALAALTAVVAVRASDAQASVPVADRFAPPVADALSTVKGQEGFCVRAAGRGRHVGQDFGVRDAPVAAVANGRVLVAGRRGDWDGIVLIEHRLPAGGRVYTEYGHLAKVLVGKGQDVRLGAPIGVSGPPPGGSGVAAHLHFEVKRVATIGSGWTGGTCPPSGALDPIVFLRENGTS